MKGEKKKEKNEGRSVQTVAVESESDRRGGRHDLAVYPQCLPQHFDAMARSQAEKFPKTCSACRWVFPRKRWAWPLRMCVPLIERTPLCRARQTLSSQHCEGANMSHSSDASVLAITGFTPQCVETSCFANWKGSSSCCTSHVCLKAENSVN